MECRDAFIAFLKEYNIPHEIVVWKYENLLPVYTSIHVRKRENDGLPQKNEWVFNSEGSLDKIITNAHHRHMNNSLYTGKIITISREMYD